MISNIARIFCGSDSRPVENPSPFLAGQKNFHIFAFFIPDSSGFVITMTVIVIQSLSPVGRFVNLSQRSYS